MVIKNVELEIVCGITSKLPETELMELSLINISEPTRRS